MLWLTLITSALLVAGFAAKAHFALRRMQRQSAIFAARLRDMEQLAQPHTSEEALLDRAMRLIERAPRCPRCRAVVRAMGRFCPSCGENFARPTTVAARLTRFAIDESTGEIDLSWQCFSCGGETRTLPDTLRAGSAQIVPLCCDHCEVDAGELLIDPTSVSVPEPRPAGSLRLPRRWAATTAT